MAEQEDELSLVLKIVSFCIPIVGLILWVTNREKKPNSAKQAITFAAIGFGIGIVLNIILNVMGAMM